MILDSMSVEYKGYQIQLNSVIFFPKVYSNKNHVFGYAWPLFYCDIFLIVPAIMYNRGIPILYGVILFTFISAFLSSYFIMELTKLFSKDMKLMSLSSVLYLFNSFYIIDTYMRTALGEQIAFIFLPMASISLYKLMRNEEIFLFYTVIAFLGLLLSHNITFIIVVIFYGFMLLINYKKTINKKM